MVPRRITFAIYRKHSRSYPPEALGVVTVVRVEDFTQDLEVDLAFTHRDDWSSDEQWKDKDPEQRYVIGGDRPVAAASSSATSAAAAAPTGGGDNAGEEKKEDEQPTEKKGGEGRR